jgi:hypothetical protein
MPFLIPLFLLILPLGGAGFFYSTRNASGQSGAYKWKVTGGWSGNFASSVTTPLGNVQIISPLGGYSSLQAAKMAALEYIARAQAQDPGSTAGVRPPMGPPLDVGVLARGPG